MSVNPLSLSVPWIVADSARTKVPPDGETSFVARAIAGDVEAFACLYDDNVARIYRHAYFRLGEASEAEDITHQTFLQAWQAIGRYRQTGAPFAAWLLAIAHNLIVDHYRRRPKGRRVDEAILAEELIDETADLERRLDHQRVQSALKQLRPDQQQILTMRLIDDLDYPAIARATGKTEGNVRVILHRSLSALRRLLEAAA
jgi:RNA polymerase sigma-70 factor (ECF subfamily)